MAVDSLGPFGQPHFDGNKAGNTASDQSAISDYAAALGNRIADTSANRAAFATYFKFNPWTGLEYYETDTGKVFVYSAGAWILIFLPWTGYTPGLGMNTGGGAIAGEYQIRAGYASVNGNITLGNGASASGPITMTMPVNRRGSAQPRGTFFAIDSANNIYPLFAILSGTAQLTLYTAPKTATAPTPLVQTGASSPLTWASGVRIFWDYEIACNP